MRDFAIGIDLGGTNFRLAVVTPHGDLRDRMHCAVESTRGKEAVVKDIVSSIRNLTERQPTTEGSLLAVGLGVAGLIRPMEGIVTESPNLPGWIDFNIRAPIEAALRVPLTIENDANCFTLGEFWQGAAKDVRELCGLTLGTGVGGGILLNGEIWRGADGMAGEVGHMVIEADGRPCKCGNRGCLEQYASATAITQFAREAQESRRESVLKKWQGSIERITAEDVFEAAKEGNTVALDIFRKVGYYLGIGIANLINLLNIDSVVVGGKVSQAWEFFITETEKTIKERAFRVPARRARIVKSLLGDDGGIVGAAYLAYQKIGRIR